MDAVRSNIQSVAKAFRLAARAETKADMDAVSSAFPPGSDAAGYGERLAQLSGPSRMGTDLRGLDFRPFFLLNGLILASHYRNPVRAFVLEVLATGLTEFLDYFAFIQDRDGSSVTPEQFEALGAQQKRYFAYCLAQLSEAGMDLDGLFMTMKGDTLDQGSSYAVRACLEDGPEAVLASELFTPAERAHWKAFFDGEPGAWERMQKHLIETYQLPFRSAPPPAENP
jgi:hypothetical protein